MNNMSFFKGMGLGLMVGSVAGAIGLAVTPKKKRASIGKALRSMGDVVDNVTSSIGL